MATSDKRTQADLETILNRATPADWYHVQRTLEMTREEISNDPGLLPATLAYFIVRQETGKADFNDYFHMPEGELLAFLNVEEDQVEEAFDEAPKESASMRTSTAKNSEGGQAPSSN